MAVTQDPSRIERAEAEPPPACTRGVARDKPDLFGVDSPTIR
jgi:hypothetical protein